MAQVLESISASEPAVAAQLDEVKAYYERSLWHEMTTALLNTTDKMSDAARHNLWDSFIKTVMDKMNSLSVAKLAVMCVPKEAAAAQAFLHGVAEKVKAEEAWAIIKAEEGTWALVDGKPKLAKEILEETKAVISKHEAHDLPPETHAAYYKAQATYLKSQDLYSEYYNTALLYLVYSDLNEMSKDQQQRWAVNIGIAALVGDRVFNFGELLNNPIMETLQGSKYVWLDRLLRAFNSGDLQGFETIVAESGSAMTEQRELKDNAEFMAQKLRLMALLQYLFTLKESSRVVPFAEVQRVTQYEDVELLLLKALALGVIRGSIDQVAGNVTVTWVQARVLGRDEAAQLAGKMKAWQSRVQQQMAELVEVWNKLEQENEAA